MKIQKSITKAATAVLVGGVLIAAAPTFTAPANASVASQVSVRTSAKATVTASATRVSGNRVRLVAKTRAKKVVIKYRAGRAYTKTVRVRRGVAKAVLPASITRIQVRAVGSHWVRVGIPQVSKGADSTKPTKGITTITNPGSSGSDDSWQNNLPGGSGTGFGGITGDLTYSPMSAQQFADETFAEINAMRASGISCGSTWMSPVAPLTRNATLDAVAAYAATNSPGVIEWTENVNGIQASHFSAYLIRPSGDMGPRFQIATGAWTWTCQALMSPSATIAGFGAENPDPNPGEKITRSVAIYIANSAG